MSALHLLYRDSYAINDSIHISIPTVGQVLDNEDSYYNVVSAITAMPIDFMVQLDDLGIDFTTINAWQLFVLLFENIKQMDKYVLSLVFGDMDLSDFEIGISPQNGKFVIRDEKHDITIDRAIHSQMASVLRKLHQCPEFLHRKLYICYREYISKDFLKLRQNDILYFPVIMAQQIRDYC